MLRLLKAKMRQTARAALLGFVLAPVPIANGAAQAQTETTPAVSQELTYEKLHDMRGAVLERRANLRKQRGQIVDARLLKNFERALRADTDDLFDQAMRPHARALRISCSEKDWDACLALAEMYQVGDGTWPDEHLAFAFHIAGCSARDPASCRGVWQNWRLDAANGRYEGHSPHLEVINDTCAAGDGDSCHQLSRGRKFGINGVAKNQNEAERLLQRACMLGNQRACRDLPKTPAEQAARHQALCDIGKQFYFFLLGEAMHTCAGIKKDVEDVESIIRESCVSGSSHACQWVFETYDTSTRDRSSLLEQGCSATPGRICNEAIRLLEKQPQNTQIAARIETLNGLACTSDDAYCKRTIWYWIDDAGNQTDPFDPGSDGFFDKPQWAAVRVARQACQVQDFDGCKHFAELFAKSGDRLGFLLAAYIFRPFCEAGDGNICLLMAD